MTITRTTMLSILLILVLVVASGYAGFRLGVSERDSAVGMTAIGTLAGDLRAMESLHAGDPSQARDWLDLQVHTNLSQLVLLDSANAAEPAYRREKCRIGRALQTLWQDTPSSVKLDDELLEFVRNAAKQSDDC